MTEGEEDRAGEERGGEGRLIVVLLFYLRSEVVVFLNFVSGGIPFSTRNSSP